MLLRWMLVPMAKVPTTTLGTVPLFLASSFTICIFPISPTFWSCWGILVCDLRQGLLWLLGLVTIIAIASSSSGLLGLGSKLLKVRLVCLREATELFR
jgi:hypothetical protein